LREKASLGLPRADARENGLGTVEDAPQRVSATAQPLSIPVVAMLPITDVSFGLSTAENPRSRLSKELYKVHQAMRAGQRKRGNPSVLVVAADDEEDTIAVSLMLAAVAAASQNVLLLDADLDQRTLAAVDGDQSDAASSTSRSVPPCRRS
jgi:Mrp family chromosome partitioning ATPase